MWNERADFIRGNVSYFYQECVPSYDDAIQLINNCSNLISSNQTQRCSQFCRTFPQVLPWVYLSISCLSMLSCIVVFLSYFLIPKLRHSGRSTKVFLLRTLMDMVIAIGHIASGIFGLAEAKTEPLLRGCETVAVINQFALFASNLWFVILAVDLVKAIMNPFSARPTYGVGAHVFIWSLSFITMAALAILTIPGIPGGPGPSMFFWCWISIETDQERGFSIPFFSAASIVFYYFWLFIFCLFSVTCTAVGIFILRNRLATSSETRRLVIRQNLWYILSLVLEIFVVLIMWVVQLGLAETYRDPNGQGEAFFFTNIDFGLAIVFAIFHSLRGTVDLIVWKFALGIGLSDIKELLWSIKDRNRKDLCKTLKTPLLVSKSGDSQVNKALRRNAMYCINIGILDAVQLHQQSLDRIKRVGSVRDPFVANQMIRHDEENQEQEREELYRENPTHREKSVRHLQFPATATIHSFSFIDLEPSIFSLLRTTFGVPPKKYRESFKIRNAADIDKEGMLEKFTEGKSGSFFYFTRDYRYIIKTLKPAEERFLLKIAYKYYHHMQNNPNSLIARFYGLHKVKLAPEQKYITVIVMEYIFHNKEQLQMHERYDLKGSWVGRRSIKGNQERMAYKGTLKDLDLGAKKFHIGADNKELFMEQLREDAQFLQSCGVMDYSLLLGVHNHSKFGERCVTRPGEHTVVGQVGEDFIDVSINTVPSVPQPPPVPEISPVHTQTRTKISLENETTLTTTSQFKNIGVPWFREDYGGLRSCSPLHPRCNEVERASYAGVEGIDNNVPVATYYFSIIDFLQEYNLLKKIEHQVKTKVQCKDKHGISAVNPKEYAQRFVDFLEKVFV